MAKVGAARWIRGSCVMFRGWDRVKIRDDCGTLRDAVAPVIISASRATDVPAFFGKWLINRISAGHLVWTNPFSGKPQYISFERARAFVFWSKNPAPMIPLLRFFDDKGLKYYFQFTLNDYDAEGYEPNVPVLEDRLEAFRLLSELVGRDRVVWRFDPLILSPRIRMDSIVEKVVNVGRRLQGHTERLVVSFVDVGRYAKVRANLRRKGHAIEEFSPAQMREFAARLEPHAAEWGVSVATCAEEVDLEEFGVAHNRCIDDVLLAKLFPEDEELMAFLGAKGVPQGELFGEQGADSRQGLKDKGQRKACGCIVSKDIGVYNTCHHLCAYCYANTSDATVRRNLKAHRPDSENLIPSVKRERSHD